MEIERASSKNDLTRIVTIRVQFDFLPKYYKICKLEGYSEVDYRVPYPKLRERFESRRNEEIRKEEKGEPGEVKHKVF